ncbi:MAG: alanine racemase [Actinomycetota bacterium]|nr:alanine racemase [Actinomycetota bacterium]
MPLRALASVNLAAIARNVARLKSELEPTGAMCAVVKADGYGHGAVQVARAALAGGTTWLAVVSAEEAAELRRAGLDGPILVLGAISAQELPVALAAGAELVAWTERFVADVARAAGVGGRPVRTHVKLDTGMGRLGTRDGAQARATAEAVLAAEPVLELAGAMTHFATADGDLEFAAQQLAAFAPFAEDLRRLAPGLRVHAANSAATLRLPQSHFDLVRCGIAIYGLDPMNEDAAARGLEPALELSSYLAAVKLAQPGDSVGYGRQFIATRETWIGTLPIGYADGIARGLSNNCDVIVARRRYPVVGTVSMDNLTIDLGPEPIAAPGDSALIIGSDGSERQTAEHLAHRLGTITHEIVCGISRRVPRTYHRDGQPNE